MNNYAAYVDKSIHIPKWAEVKLTTMGNILQIKHTSALNHEPTIRKISGTEYIDLRSGRKKQFKKNLSENRAQSPISMKNTFQNIARIVQANIADPQKVRWVTLTYAENMTDCKQLYEDYRRFYGRLKSYCSRHGWDYPEYISVAEPQARGAWHLHVFFIWKNTPAPYLPNNDLADLWTHGFTKIRAIKANDNVAGYLIAYLSDLDLNDPDGNKLNASGNKKLIKRGRLQYYPRDFKICRHSRGITYPTIESVHAFEAFEMVKGSKPVFHCKKVYETEDFKNTIQILEFKKGANGSWANNTDLDEDWEYNLYMDADGWIHGDNIKKDTGIDPDDIFGGTLENE